MSNIATWGILKSSLKTEHPLKQTEKKSVRKPGLTCDRLALGDEGQVCVGTSTTRRSFIYAWRVPTKLSGIAKCRLKARKTKTK